MDENDLVAEFMAAVATTLYDHTDVDEVVRSMTRAARDFIPGVDYAGVSLAQGSTLETWGATDRVVRRVDTLQYDLNEGPCVDAFTTRQQTWTNHLAVDERWPRFGPEASELGIGSQMGVALIDRRQVIGSLNLYAAEPEAFSPGAVRIAALFAVHAAHALGRTVETEPLADQLAVRRIIGVATGLLMERHALDAQQAFQVLVDTAHQEDVAVRAVAERLVSDADLDHSRPT